MERTTANRYAELDAKLQEFVPLDSKRLLTDRSAYISFLEVQLERVTTSCLSVQGFADRIEQLQAQVTTADEKMANLSRQLTLLQKDNHETERLAEMEEKVSGGID